jgi:pimeloyl-ACP methyl ester carboxylesterase
LNVSVGIILIALLLLVGVFLAASVALSRATHEVGNARGDEYLELEGHWIRYRVSGGGPPVLLVHGWLQSGRIWEGLARRLEGRFTVYSLDLAGFGESDKPISGYGVRYGSRLLYAFCAHFGLTRAAVIGHDLGGAMALKLAADHPDVVGRIVLVATPANEEQIDLPTPLWLATLPVVGPVVYSLGRVLRPVRRLWMRPFVLDRESLTEEVVEDAGRSTPAAVAKSLSVMRREIARGRLLRQAGVIKTPVLAIAGEEDEIVDPQSTGDWSRALRAEVVLLNDCGHLPQLERTREFDARILAFLTGDASYLESLPEEAPDAGMLPDDETRPIDDAGDADGVPPAASRGNTQEPGRPEPDEVRVRKRGSQGRATGETEHSGNGVERWPLRRVEGGRAGDDEPAVGGSRRSADGDTGGPIPELPEDLFRWPAAWKEFRPPEDTSGRSPRDRGEDEGGPAAETTEGEQQRRDGGPEEPYEQREPRPPSS